ncbi:MAG: site-specific integrase, partial [Xanthomonadales bacterium]|nr:site-specific integrase [Xanthomonadales bacterium]
MHHFQQHSLRYLDYCRYERNLSLHSIRAYEQDLSDFKKFLSSINQNDATDKDISTYLKYLSIERSLSPATIKRRTACLKTFYAWLKEKKLIQENPFSDLKINIKLPKQLPKSLNKRELKKLRRASSVTKLTIPHDTHSHHANDIKLTSYLAIELMACTGMRVSEVTLINIEDVNVDEGKIKIFGKGSRERNVYILHPAILKSIRNYLSLR